MDNKTFVAGALDYIAKAYKDEDLSLERVAEKAGFSVSYFNRIFTESTGKPVMEYVREYRLIMAAQLLRASDKSILELALDFGYANPENFTRAFKTRYGVSPSEYREKHKNISLTWKDAATGTVIRRFENEFPNLERIDIDELTDWLYTQNPIRYAFNIFFSSQIDCAAYRLSEENEYIFLEEYRAEEITLTLFCKEENIPKYIDMGKMFPKCMIGYLCDPDFSCPEDKYSFSRFLELYDYAYLKETINFCSLPEYTVRHLDANDKETVKKFAKMPETEVVGHVYEQNMQYGNFDGTFFIGLFKQEKLIACCMPEIEIARDFKNCEIGGIFFIESEKTETLMVNFCKAVISDNLKNGLTPTIGGARADDDSLNAAVTERIGYTCISKRIWFTDSADLL